MKKFFSVMLLAFAIIFVSNQAEAREVYVGSYSDGTAVYVLTETIQRLGAPFDCNCTVRAGRDYLDYSFFWENDVLYYRNSEGYHGTVYGGQSPVAAAIYRYIRG